jgi:tetratricopeptide (TPR) repeat protein
MPGANQRPPGEGRRGLIFLSWVALTLLLIGACGDPKQKEAALLEEGKALFDNNDNDGARRAFVNALRINPDGIDAHYYLGLIEEREQNWEGAWSQFKILTNKNPEYLEAQLKVAWYAMYGDNMRRAEEQIQLVRQLAPDNPEVWFLLASYYYRQGRDDEAIAQAKAVLTRWPGHDDTTILFARALNRRGETERAIAEIEQLLGKMPTLKLMKAKAELLRDQRRFGELLDVHKRIIALEPNNLAHYHALVALNLELDRAEEAIETLRESIARGLGGMAAKFELVDLVLEKFGRKAGEAELESFLAGDPTADAFRLRLSEVAADDGDLAQAIERLQQVVDRVAAHPKQPLAESTRKSLAMAADLHVRQARLGRSTLDIAERLIGLVLEVDPLSPEALLVRAEIALDRSDVEAATLDLQGVFRAYPESPTALRLLARAQILSGKPDVAVETLQRVITLDPGNHEARLQLVALLRDSRRLEIALKLLDEAEALFPDWVPYLRGKVELLITLQMFEGAEDSIRKLHRLRGQQVLAFLLTGLLRRTQGRYSEAIEAYAEAAALVPGDPEPLRGIVEVEMLSGNSEAASTLIQKFLVDWPRSPEAHNLLGELRVSQGRKQEAEQSFLAAIRMAGAWAVPHRNLARLLLDLGRLEEAKAVLSEGIAQTATDLQLLFALAEVEQQSGNDDQAIAVYEKVLRVQSNFDAAAYRLAKLIAERHYGDKNRLREALRLAKRFENSSNAAFVDVLGWLQYRSGELRRARANLERAIALDPNRPEFYYHLGTVLHRLGEPTSARRMLAKAVVDDAAYPGMVEARDLLDKLTSQSRRALPAGDGMPGVRPARRPGRRLAAGGRPGGCRGRDRGPSRAGAGALRRRRRCV